ncbi:MAG TPA: caspase family protein [Longimicrobium sp.]|nr:caspase family protein [Longimicrobium sp.]
MSRAVSIHIGVDRPHGGHVPLQSSENNAWRMACLANQAGYESLLVLRGRAATRQAVHDVLTRVAGVLTAGTQLFLTFSGHGCERHDHDADERSRKDQGWCLADGEIVDDKLAGYWRLFEPGVRILVVSESCYSGGVIREDDKDKRRAHPRPPAQTVYRGQPGPGGTARSAPAAEYTASCIGEPPRGNDGIRASLLLLSASCADQPAQEGLFARHLLATWNEGAFRGTYCDLHRQVRDRVMSERSSQDPQILMIGAADPGFPLETAFHLAPPSTTPPVAYRANGNPRKDVLHW